ncbi:hypothetical protein [Nocardia wallacei]|uniref:hypothetical protein n=1 Tax=Nocardia wallacei TaxID=480035 RepID=UPI002454086E|nr:hypothetical protein [Nocardia wallacei]
MTDTPSTALTRQQADLLREVHANVSAAAAMIDLTGHIAWPPDIAAEHRALLGQLLAAGGLAEDQARTAGVPDRMITMAWLAGHRRLHWPATEPAALDAALRESTWAGLRSDLERLQDMAAIHLARAHHLGLIDGVADPDPDGTEQYARNSIAMGHRALAIADLLELDADQWQSLWLLPVDTGHAFSVRYMHPDAAEMVSLRWAVYANPDVELNALLTERAIRGRTSDPAPQPRHAPGPAPDTAPDPTVTAMPGTDTRQPSAADTALPSDTDRSWHGDTGPTDTVAPDRAAPDAPGAEPW